jgi:hypothetical protein
MIQPIRFRNLIFAALLTPFTSLYAGQNPAAKGGTTKSAPFAENKQWEQRLSDRLRSSAELHLISPISGTNYDGDRLVFEWTPGKKQKIFLGLMNNENKEIFYKEVSGNKVVLLASEINLSPGLYYWVLENEEDVLSVGKVFYKKK